MKILQINAVYKHSSTGLLTYELHQYMKSKNVKSAIAAVDVPCENDEYIKFSSFFSGIMHALLSRVFGRQGYFSYFATKKFIRKIKKFSPDVVHIGVIHSNCINLPLLLGYLAENDIPTVITLHDCWYFTGHCCYFVDTHCDRWKEGCGHCPDIRNWNKSLFFDFSAKNLTDKKYLFGNIRRLAVVGVSDWVASLAKESILKDSMIIKRIYNWIDTETFKPIDTSRLREELMLQDKFVILCCSQYWNKAKGFFDIIEMSKRCPDFIFVLIGGIPQEYLPLPLNVISVGVLSDIKKLAEYYSLADVFFNPSSRETFGKVTVEAMACGTPVVAYNLTATPELIKDGCGYVVDYQNYDKIKKCFEKIFMEGKKAYQEKCAEFAHTNFGSEKLMNEYINLYKKLISA